MDTIMEYLYTYLKWLVETKWFKRIMSVLILLNPVVIAPQVVKIITATNIEGVSLIMWTTFTLIQLAIMFNGVRTKDAAIFFSMFVSALESTIIILIIFMRS